MYVDRFKLSNTSIDVSFLILKVIRYEILTKYCVLTLFVSMEPFLGINRIMTKLSNSMEQKFIFLC